MSAQNGVIRERRPGVWEVRVYVGRDAQGHVLQKSRTVHGGKRKAEDARRALLAEVRAGRHQATHGTVAHLLQRHLSMLERKNASPSTLRAYRAYIANNIEPELGAILIEDLAPERLDDFYRKLEDSGLARSTVRQHHAILSGALRQAVKWGWLTANPAERATPPALDDAEVVAPTVEQVQRLVALAEDRNPTLAALLCVAATTGARRGELCAMKWSNVDLDRRSVLIAESVVEPKAGQWAIKGTKTHKRGRVALDDFTVAVLTAHRERVLVEAANGGVSLAPDGYVFSQDLNGARPYRPSLVTGFFSRLRVDAGCPAMKLHHLRHFVATHAIASGADVRTVAGRLRHNANMTLKVYSHLLEERDRAVADHMGALMEGTTP